MLQIQVASQMWATRPHLGSIFEKLLHRKTFYLPAARILQPTTNHTHRKELIPWQLFLSVPLYWMLWCSPALHRATPTAMNSPTKFKACSQSQSPHSIPFCGDCKKTNTYKPMTSPIKGETAGITTSPMPDGRLWKPTVPNGSSTNNKLTNF